LGTWGHGGETRMRDSNAERRRQKGVVFVGLLFFGLILFLIQLWLFVLVLENVIAGKTAMATPAAVASIVLLGANLWMLAGVTRILKMK